MKTKTSTITLRILATIFITSILPLSASGQRLPADDPPGFVPLGVYLSWERIGANARALGVDKWEDLNHRLDALAANHVNTLWVTNLLEVELPRLIQECQKRNIKLLPCLGEVEQRVPGRSKLEDYYQTVVPRVVQLVGQSDTVLGWVLSDEPANVAKFKMENLAHLEKIRLEFRKHDPKRFCLVVSKWPTTPHVPIYTQLPVLCVDLYPFFGPGDINGPHTDVASKAFYRSNIQKMMQAIGESNRVGWVMASCFSEIWGPRKYDKKNWHLIGLEGSYLHWRAPTLSEMRWQIWEAIRKGAKGVLIYTLAPEPDWADSDKLVTPAGAQAWKEILAKKPTDMGVNALTNPDGSVTPQLVEMGKAYQALQPLRPLIARWQPCDTLSIDSLSPESYQVFRDPSDGVFYCVVVNDSFSQKRDIHLRFEAPVTKVLNLRTDQDLLMKEDFANGIKLVRVLLEPGDGTVLTIFTTPNKD